MSEGYDGLPSYYVKSSDPVTPKYGFSLKGMDPILAENWVLADSAIGSGGSTVEINGVTVSDPNFNNTTPAAPVGDVNVTWQVDASGNVSAYVSLSGGSSVEVNGVAVSDPNFNNTTPAPVAGYLNSIWTTDGSGNVSSSIFPDSVTALTTGSVSPIPVYAYNEAPSTINPFFYIQDAAGNWHQQAGIDTVTGPNNYPNLGPPVPGTLTWTRRMFFRDDLASTQATKNSFLSVKHAAGSGTSQENQDRALGILMGNGTASVTAITVSNGTVTFQLPAQTLSNIVPGQVYVLTGFSTYTQYNQVPYYVESFTSSSITAVVAPLTLSSASTAVSGNTTYNGYINQRTITGQSVLIAGFSNAANNGTFTIVSNTGNNIVVNNPNGIAETPSGIPTATIQLANQSLVIDSGTLDQWLYSMAGIQCEVDLNGNSPQFTQGIDGEVTVFSGQISLTNTGTVTVPSTGIQVVRAQVFKSGAGQLGGSDIGASAITANVSINNTAANGFTEFVGVLASVIDGVGGAPQTIGIDYFALYGGSNRCAYSNYGLYVSDFSTSYTVTSVLAASGGLTSYLGAFPTAGSLNGQSVRVTGFSNAVNNGVFQVSSNTIGTLSLNNPSGVPETTTVRIQMLNDYAIRVVGGQTYFGGTLQLVGGFIDSTGSYGTNGQVLSSTGTATLWANASSGSGTVTSVAMTGDGTIFNATVTGSPITTSGTLIPVLLTQTANTFLAGPATGSAASPTFRALTVADLPSGYLWNNNGNANGNLTLANGNFTTTFNQTSRVAWTWANTTAGTSSSVNSSPVLQLEANYYSGSLSEPDTWSIGTSLGVGVNGSSLLGILHSGTSGLSGVLIGNSQFTTSVENSPYLVLGGSYEVSASLNTFAEDNWYFQNVIGSGANGSSTLTVSHAGTEGTANVTFQNINDLIVFNSALATASSTNSSPAFACEANYWTGSGSSADVWTLTSSLAAGTNGVSTITLAHSGSTGAAVFKAPNFSPTVAIPASSQVIGLYGAGNNLALNGNGSSTYTLLIEYSGTAIIGISGNTANPQFQMTNLGIIGWGPVNPISNSNFSDTGFSRLSAGALALGNGTYQDYTGSLQMGTLIQKNGTAGTATSTNASPQRLFEANYYSGSLSEPDTWSMGSVLGVGVNGSSLLEILHSGTTGLAGVLIGNLQFTTSVENSPYLILAGSYEESASAGVYREDNWYLQNVIGAGLNGTSTLQFSHAGTPGTALVQVPILGVGTANSLTVNGSGVCTVYKGLTTTRGGLAPILNSAFSTAQSAAISGANIIASGSGYAVGMWRISFVANITTAASVSSALGGTTGFQITFTNANGDTLSKTTNLTSPTISAGNTTSTSVSGDLYCYAGASTNITYSFGYTSSGTAMVYDIAVYAEYLG